MTTRPSRPLTSPACRPARLIVSRWVGWFVGWLLFAAVSTACADGADLSHFDVVRTDEGVLLSFAIDFELPRAVDEALQKGVPLYFVARAEVFRSRWYWRDRRVASAERVWRLAFQPLTRKYRVSFGGLNQSFDQLNEALASTRRMTNWKVAEAGQVDTEASHYVEFSYRLDTSLLPRPLQIGIGGQPDWSLRLERQQRLE